MPRTHLWSMIRVIWRPVGLIGFFLGFFLFSSMFGELSEMILNQHLILRRMVYNSSPGHTFLSSMIPVFWNRIPFSDQFLSYFFEIFSVLKYVQALT